MFTKILIFLAVVVGVFVVARMGAASALKPAKKRKKDRLFRGKKSEDMIICPTCGAYTVKGDVCSCGRNPTP